MRAEFRRFGDVDLVENLHERGVVVTFATEEDAGRCIDRLHNRSFESGPLRAARLEVDFTDPPFAMPNRDAPGALAPPPPGGRRPLESPDRDRRRSPDRDRRPPRSPERERDRRLGRSPDPDLDRRMTRSPDVERRPRSPGPDRRPRSPGMADRRPRSPGMLDRGASHDYMPYSMPPPHDHPMYRDPYGARPPDDDRFRMAMHDDRFLHEAYRDMPYARGHPLDRGMPIPRDLRHQDDRLPPEHARPRYSDPDAGHAPPPFAQALDYPPPPPPAAAAAAAVPPAVAPTLAPASAGATPPSAPAPVPPGALAYDFDRVPHSWYGLLALKNTSVPVRMHMVAGNPEFLKVLPPPNETIKISQRMRWTQVAAALTHTLNCGTEYFGMLIVRPGFSDQDLPACAPILSTSFVQYLREKQAAGIVQMLATGSTMYVLPPCEFAHEHLGKAAKIEPTQALNNHLLLIIAASPVT